MAKNSSSTSAGIGIGGALFLIFLVLKLAEIGSVAHWSWWWVTSPIWIPVLIGLVVLLIYWIVLVVRDYRKTSAR